MNAKTKSIFENLVQSELSPMGDSTLLHSAPLYCQHMGLTVHELLAQRLDSANCQVSFFFAFNQ